MDNTQVKKMNLNFQN